MAAIIPENKPNPYKARMFWGAAFFIGAALLFDALLGGPKIYIEQKNANIAAIVLTSLFFLMICWTLTTNFKLRGLQTFILSGPHNFLRAPLPATFIIFGFTAFAILLKSWLILFAIIPIYTIWTQIMETKEAWLAQKYGQDYLIYQKQTGLFLPRLRQLNKPAFYSTSALIVFITIFIGLNFSSVYLRWVAWAKPARAITQASAVAQIGAQSQNNGLFAQIFSPSSTNARTAAPPQTATKTPISQNLVFEPNTIIIEKLNLRAPIVSARGISQKELNAALDNGVVLYPGSALPGENGEVFLTGHSSVFPWNKTKYGQVFTLLDKLEAGDIVTLIYNNQRYDYKISAKEVLKPDQLTLSSTREPRLTLMTCWPIGTALKRLAVYGELTR